ncbi:MAG: SynChlorMet cassette protein ScmC [Candidatus Omnitrophota bacterium]
MVTPVYTLFLEEELKWYITATEDASSWMHKFAAIMQLEPSSTNRFSKLIFTTLQVDQKLSSALARTLHDCSGDIFPPQDWWFEDLGLVKFWRNQHSEHIICQLSGQSIYEVDINKMSLSLHVIYQKAIEKEGLPLHAGLVEKEEMGVVLAAPGSTGKSTCCRRIPFPWHALCDDETLLVRDVQGSFYAHPFPTWSEYLCKRSERTWNVERRIPLSAIFFLAQSETEELAAITQAESAAFLHQLSLQIYGRGLKRLKASEGKKQSRCLFDNACQLAKSLPAYMLRVSREGRFWEKMEEALERVC